MKIEDALALIEQLKSEKSELENHTSALSDEVDGLRNTNVKLSSENSALNSQITVLDSKIVGLEGVITDIKAEREKQDAELYIVNKKLAEYIKRDEALREKKKISEIKRFIPQSETLESIINEPEKIIKEAKIYKKRGIKQGSKKHKNIDFEAVACETRYEKPTDTICPNCGSALTAASDKVRYVIEAVPASVKVVKIVKQSYKCPNCNKLDNKIYYPLSNSAFPGSVLTPSFAAYILYHKYELGIPLNHLAEHVSQTLGIEVSKQSLADYVKKCAILLDPILEKLKTDLLNGCGVIHADETTLVVSKDAEKQDNRKKSYVYVYASSFYDVNQINIYSFHETRAIDRTAEWLKNFKGTVICDDYSGYNSLVKTNPDIKLQKCWAHVRRRFADIIKALPQNKAKSSVSYVILELIARLFQSEEFYKNKKYAPSKIVEHRKAEHLKIKEKLYDLFFENEYVKGSAICAAVDYAKGVWNDLWTYLDNGYVEISNNTAERAVKPFVIQRKAFQTAGSYAGARYTTTLFSIIRTAMENDINVEQYLEYLLRNITNISVENLVPYSENIKTLFTNK